MARSSWWPSPLFGNKVQLGFPYFFPSPHAGGDLKIEIEPAERPLVLPLGTGFVEVIARIGLAHWPGDEVGPLAH
jgi:hypothetical protein